MYIMSSLHACGLHVSDMQLAGHGGSNAGGNGEKEARTRRRGEKEKGQTLRGRVALVVSIVSADSSMFKVYQGNVKRGAPLILVP